MPQNPRSEPQQARIIRARLERLAAPGGPLADAALKPRELTDAELRDSIDADEPWPVNLKTVALDLVPDLNRGDAEVLG